MTKILAITGTYRNDGIIDQAVEAVADAARRAGAEFEVVALRDYPIGFCRNCRECMQAPGEAPGPCVQHDAMDALVARIEAADRLVLASPTNFFTATALFKRFMERLAVYAYWPWGQHGPKYRKPRATKKALAIASCAAPGLVGRLFYSTLRQLRMAAKTVGAEPTGLVLGFSSGEPHPRLRPADARRLERAAQRLLRA